MCRGASLCSSALGPLRANHHRRRTRRTCGPTGPTRRGAARMENLWNGGLGSIVLTDLLLHPWTISDDCGLGGPASRADVTTWTAVDGSNPSRNAQVIGSMPIGGSIQFRTVNRTSPFETVDRSWPAGWTSGPARSANSWPPAPSPGWPSDSAAWPRTPRRCCATTAPGAPAAAIYREAAGIADPAAHPHL